MLFLIVGVPDFYCDRARIRFRRELPEHSFVVQPLRPNGKSNYIVDEAHCVSAIQTASNYISGRAQAGEGGIGTLMLLRPWEKEDFRDAFRVFSLFRWIRTNQPTIKSGSRGHEAANKQIDELLAAARRIIPAGRAISNELAARLNRTPLLLPLAHFGDEGIHRLLNQTENKVHGASDPASEIMRCCAEFEDKHPFVRVGKKGGWFINTDGVTFKNPGRDLHGTVRSWNAQQGHDPTCYLTAVARLGGPIQPGFHYDCSIDRGAHAGWFSNCHGAVRHYEGHPHLNVFPNDYIRSQQKR